MCFSPIPNTPARPTHQIVNLACLWAYNDIVHVPQIIPLGVDHIGADQLLGTIHCPAARDGQRPSDLLAPPQRSIRPWRTSVAAMHSGLAVADVRIAIAQPGAVWPVPVRPSVCIWSSGARRSAAHFCANCAAGAFVFEDEVEAVAAAGGAASTGAAKPTHRAAVSDKAKVEVLAALHFSFRFMMLLPVDVSDRLRSDRRLTF